MDVYSVFAYTVYRMQELNLSCVETIYIRLYYCKVIF